MTTQAMEPAAEPLAAGVARRVRGLMGEKRLSGNRMAPMMGMSQQSLSRRTTGELDFSLAELEQLADLLGVNVGFLLGFQERQSPQAQEGMGEGAGVRHQGLEPRTRWLTVASAPVARILAGSPRPVPSPAPAEDLAEVVDLATWRRRLRRAS